MPACDILLGLRLFTFARPCEHALFARLDGHGGHITTAYLCGTSRPWQPVAHWRLNSSGWQRHTEFEISSALQGKIVPCRKPSVFRTAHFASLNGNLGRFVAGPGSKLDSICR
jgi:hypothetical protein